MSRLSRYFHEPWFINMLHIVGYTLAVGCGLLAAMGGIPNIITGQIGPVLSVVVGVLLVWGGLTGAWSVWRGLWGLEQIAIWIIGIGYVALLVPTLAFAVLPGKSVTSTIWLIVALEVQAILASAIRYRRIDWAYLDPAK
jgi:Uncharacterized protein conserved in bacteria